MAEESSKEKFNTFNSLVFFDKMKNPKLSAWSWQNDTIDVSSFNLHLRYYIIMT